jgi:probable rRNA maturation factor
MINFTSIETNYILKNKLQIRNWIKSILEAEMKLAGDITFVFCNDAYLGNLNKKFLRHNTLTDIITFDYSENGKLSGDICISIERINENSAKYGKTFNEELGRVMAHGVLHLAGYKDKNPEDKKEMRRKEDQYLPTYPNL